MDEHRSTKRHRVLKAGSIQIGGGGAIDCTVRNLSHFGAALDVQMVIPSDELRFACRIAWREAGRIGIRFG
jgi:hypothetical protein